MNHLTQRIAAGLLGLVLLAPAPPLPAQVRLPALGDDGEEGFTVSAERRLGEQIMREIRRDPAYFDDPVLLDYLNALWRPLVNAARRRGDLGVEIGSAFAFELFLVQDKSVNAFALPGGHVGVHLGLIGLTADSDELASVLAHELSHVTQRHIARMVAGSNRQSAVGVAAMLLGILVAMRSNNPDAAQAAIMGGQGLMIQGQLNFSRDMEREADRIGYGIFADAGFGAAGMAGMFDKMDQASRLNDAGAYPYLRSHPLTLDRLAEARARLPLAGDANTVMRSIAGPPRLHELMRARAQVLMDPSVVALKRLVDQWSAAGAGESIGPGRLYAAALAASRMHDHAAAARALAQLQREGGLASDPRAETAALMLGAELALARGDGNGATAELARLPASATARSEMFLRTQVALERLRATPAAAERRADVSEAAQRLQGWLALHAADAPAWALLGQAHEALGHRLRALRAQAEQRAALGDLGAAIDRLRSAQQAARNERPADHVEASVIDARLRDLELQRRQLAAEMRQQRGGGRSEPERQ
jgi:predicted Zn-dependent protease